MRLGAARRAVGLDQISKDFELECSEINQNLFKVREISPKLGYTMSYQTFSFYFLICISCRDSGAVDAILFSSARAR